MDVEWVPEWKPRFDVVGLNEAPGILLDEFWSESRQVAFV